MYRSYFFYESCNLSAYYQNWPFWPQQTSLCRQIVHNPAQGCKYSIRHSERDILYKLFIAGIFPSTWQLILSAIIKNKCRSDIFANSEAYATHISLTKHYNVSILVLKLMCDFVNSQFADFLS